jgi:hypothetical protein
MLRYYTFKNVIYLTLVRVIPAKSEDLAARTPPSVRINRQSGGRREARNSSVRDVLDARISEHDKGRRFSVPALDPTSIACEKDLRSGKTTR